MLTRDVLADHLVLCACGHDLARHEVWGCRGSIEARCGCPANREAALESAIYRARTDPWAYFEPTGKR